MLTNGLRKAIVLDRSWTQIVPIHEKGKLCMLVLTRKIGEKVMIGDDVTVTILGLFGNHVRLGINAPKSVDIHREEIYVKIRNDDEGDSNAAIAVG